MNSTVHAFNVWHPKQGLPADYQEQYFEFKEPVSRQFARDIVTRVEGYVVASAINPREKGAYIRKPRARKQKVS